jgi:ADP-ribose pyrophosphatase YjhB (NUDIX family)
MEPQWLQWAKALQAIAQNGLAYTENPFDRERYEVILEMAAEIMANHSDVDATHIADLFKGQTGYATPKVDVRGVVFHDERILLVRERDDARWTLPGGWADVNESASEAVVREIREESGFETVAVKLLAVYDKSKHPHELIFPFHVYKHFFLCELTGGEPTTGIETSDVGFFAEEVLPDLSLSRVTAAQVARCFEHYRRRDLPTDFD